MDKRYLHHLWTRIRPIKTGYFLAAFLLTATICVLALRSNYQTMVSLRASVYQADRDNGDIELALQTLRTHVNGHMNTNLSSGSGSIYPPIHLKETYQRLKNAEQARVEAVNSQVYTDAQSYCEQLYPTSVIGKPRVPCVAQYVKDHGATVMPIPDALYKFDFASPRWSPDLAGWMLALSLVLLFLTILRFVLGRLLRSASK